MPWLASAICNWYAQLLCFGGRCYISSTWTTLRIRFTEMDGRSDSAAEDSRLCKKSISGDVEFTFFPKLPIELRCKIWAIAFDSKARRVVEIRFESDIGSFSKSDWTPNFWSPSPAPALVNVCQEAREVANKKARKIGQLLFNKIFFDPTLDVLYVPGEDPEDVLRELKRELRPEKVRFFAEDINFRAAHFSGCLYRFENLKEIILVSPEHNPERISYSSKHIFGVVCRVHSSLWAQYAYRTRKMKYLGHPAPTRPHFPKVCKLAIKRCGRFICIKTSFDREDNRSYNDILEENAKQWMDIVVIG